MTTTSDTSPASCYVGKLAVRNRRGVMTDWRYAHGKNYLPPDAEVRRLRPQG